MLSTALQLVAWLAACLPQDAPDEAFARVRPAEAIQRPMRGRAPGGFLYEIVDGRLGRALEGPPRPIPCVQEEGTGEARAFAHHPAGTTWLAAERGLFCTSPEVDVLDAVELEDGAPPGEPIGLALGDGLRLWIATRDAFGCVDARQFFGRTFGPADGLPPGPYRALAAAADGSLLLATEGAIHRYTPGRGEEPRVALRSVNGRPHPAGETVELGTDGALAVELEGAALGGASFRYRFARHHLWRAIDGDRAELGGLEPGEHEIHFAAFDRDLRRSEPAVVRVRVPYPPQLSTALLPPLFAAVAAVVFGIALFRSRGGDTLRRRKALLSAVLVIVVGLQVLAGVVPHGRSWPVVGYAMYTDVYREGDLTYGMTLYGVTPDLERRPLRLYDAGEGQFDQQRDLAPLLHGSPAEREAVRARYVARTGHGNFAGFVVLDERQRLTAHGPVRVAPVVLAVVPEDLFDARR